MQVFLGRERDRVRQDVETLPVKLWSGNIDAETTDDELRERVRSTRSSRFRGSRGNPATTHAPAPSSSSRDGRNALFPAQRRPNGMH